MLTDEEAFEQYGDESLHFSHYYNFVFIYKSKEMDNGDSIYLQMGGTMEKVSAMSVDVEEHQTWAHSSSSGRGGRSSRGAAGAAGATARPS